VFRNATFASLCGRQALGGDQAAADALCGPCKDTARKPAAKGKGKNKSKSKGKSKNKGNAEGKGRGKPKAKTTVEL